MVRSYQGVIVDLFRPFCGQIMLKFNIWNGCKKALTEVCFGFKSVAVEDNFGFKFAVADVCFGCTL